MEALEELCYRELTMKQKATNPSKKLWLSGEEKENKRHNHLKNKYALWITELKNSQLIIPHQVSRL